MSTYLYRLARFAFLRRRLVLGVWLAAVIVAVALAAVSGGKTNDNFTVPGTESQDASDLLSEKVPELAGGQTQVVFATKGAIKVTDSSYRAGVEAAIENLQSVPQVLSVSDPYDTKVISSDQQVALSQVQFGPQPADVKDSSLDAMKEATAPARDAGVQVEYGGSVYPGWRTEVSELPELIGMIVAFVILLITFGAFVAAGLPILSAVIGVAVTLSAVTAVAAVIDIASASTPRSRSCWGCPAASTTACSFCRGTVTTFCSAWTSRTPSRWPLARRAVPWCSPRSP